MGLDKSSGRASQECWKFLISGVVQGVGYRWFARGEAERLGVQADARNLPDGTVEVRAQAPADLLEKFKARLREGPALARVDRIEIAKLKPND